MEDQIQENLQRLKKENIKFLHMQFTDIQGIVKTLTLPENRFEDALTEGVVFDGSSVAGYAQIEESDMRAVPDLSTFTVSPYSTGGNAARYICNIFNPDGTRFEGDPRYVLEKNLKQLWEEGKDLNVGPEFEFFLFRKDEHGGSPRMAMGGTGDLLAGLTGGFISRGMSPFRSAALASFICKRNGEDLEKYSSYWFGIDELIANLNPMMRKYYAFAKGTGNL